MALTYDGTNGITFNDGSQIGSASQMGIRNRIINGHMIIDQRSAGASYTPTDGAYGTCDRFLFRVSQSSKITAQQMNSANSSVSNYESGSTPSGFTNSLKITSSSAYSIGSSDFFAIEHRIEGNNVYDLDFGLSTAKTVTLSFWVKSSLTGTFGGSIANGSFARSYPFTYTINSANTWQQIVITIPGDVTGTWYRDNQTGLRICFGLGVGSSYSGTANAWAASTSWSATGATSLVGTNAATWYVTGVQLEKGSVATPFDFRLYGKELLMAQRYYWQAGIGLGGVTQGSTAITLFGNYPATMRTLPTVTVTSALTIYQTGIGGSKTQSSAQGGINASINSAGSYAIECGNFSGLTNPWQCTVNTGLITFSSEL